MREMSGGAVVPADGELVLKPGGDHIMLTGVRTPLRPGEHFPMTLHFKSSGRRDNQSLRCWRPIASGPGPKPR